MAKSHHFDRGRVLRLTERQWSLVRRLFETKWEGMRVTPEEVAGAAQLPRGASLALLAALDQDEAVDLRLTVYHSCRSRPVGSVRFMQGFPTYPWTCPGCEETLCGPTHTVVENLRYGIIGWVKCRIYV